jgi:adenylylsulfate kinase-like enzyme
VTKIIWFTGLSGTGKSTLTFLLRDKLIKKQKRVLVIDGDKIRDGYAKK